jgi:small GTP-binding protein
MVSKDQKQIIDHITQRFLNPKMNYNPDDFNSISDILNLPLYALKNVTQEDANIYEDVFKVSKIRDMSKLDPEHPLNYLLPPQTDPDIEKHLLKCEEIIQVAKDKIKDQDKLRTTILIASMISNSWAKRSDYLKKKDTKIITIGLDNAGKTAILSSLGGKLGLDTLATLKPTKRIERRKISTDTLDLFIWDFGGQEDYRKVYLESPEKFFLRTDLMIYVIDMQDAARFQNSLDYYTEILQIMQRLSESPYILVFLHKADPDLINDPDFQVALEFIQEKIKFIMKEFAFEFDMYITSIYNFFTSEPRFSKYIKDVLKDQQSLTDPMLQKVQGLGEIINTTLNAIMTLASSLGEQLARLEYRMDAIEQEFNAAKAEGAILSIPKSPKEKTTQETVPRMIPTSPINPTLQQIQNSAVVSSRNLQNLQLNAAPGINEAPRSSIDIPEAQKKEQTRVMILKDLQSLFQKAKTLKK